MRKKGKKLVRMANKEMSKSYCVMKEFKNLSAKVRHGGTGVQGQPDLPIEFQDSQGNPFSKKQNKSQKQPWGCGLPVIHESLCSTPALHDGPSLQF